MEPQNEIRQNHVEVASQKIEGPGFELPNVDSGEILQNNFNQESLAEQASRIVEMATPVPTVVATPPVQQADDVSVVDNTTPSTALDGDLMEKEWVNNLIKMVNETRSDPYLREKRFRDMQIDYLKKRYGRIIGGGQ